MSRHDPRLARPRAEPSDGVGSASGVASDQTATPSSPPSPLQQTSVGWRPLIVAFLALTMLATLTLYVAADATDRLFAWTIEPPLSAAFLGAGYASGFLLIALVAREPVWANARIALATVTLFVWLTSLATMLHLDLLHFRDHDASGFARFSAWLWLAVYIVVPVWMAAMLIVQARAAGAEPPRSHPMPRATVVVLNLQGFVLVVGGVQLMVVPRDVTGWWPWEVAPFAGRATGAWLISLGVAALLAANYERDFTRLRAASWTYVAFAVLQAGALVRFAGDVRWEHMVTWAWLAVLVSIATVGAHGVVMAGRRPRASRR